MLALALIGLVATVALSAAAPTPVPEARAAVHHFNQTTRSDQTGLSMAARGDAVLGVWASRKQNNGLNAVYGRVFGPGLEPRTDEFPLFDDASIPHANPAAAATPDGFVAVWESGGDGGGTRIMLRRFSAAGVPLGPSGVVGRSTLTDAMARVDSDTAGGLVVAWRDHGVIVGVEFSPDGERVRDLRAGLPSGWAVSSIAVDTLETGPAMAIGFSGGGGVGGVEPFIGVARWDDGSPVGALFTVERGGAVEPSILAADGPDGQPRILIAWTDLTDPFRHQSRVGVVDMEEARVSVIEADGTGPDSPPLGASWSPSFGMDGGVPVVVDQHTPSGGERAVRLRSLDGRVLALIPDPRHQLDARGGQNGPVFLDGHALVGVAGEFDPAGTDGAKVDRRGVGAWRVAVADGPMAFAANDLPPSAAIALRPVEDARVTAPVEWIEPIGVQPPDESVAGANGEQGFMAFENPNGTSPADSDIAVGPTQIVAVINRQLKVFTKSSPTTLECTLNFDAITATSGDIAFDPVVAYDRAGQRFLVVATAAYGHAGVTLAISKGSSVSCNSADDWGTSWDIFEWLDPTIPALHDFPTLGYTATKIIISYLGFDQSGNATSRVVCFDRSTSQFGPVFDCSDGGRLRVVSPTQHLNGPDIGYIVSDQTDGRSLALRAILPGTGANPTTITDDWFPIPVDRFLQPISIAQGNSAFRMPLLDSRSKNAVFRDGYLWFVNAASPFPSDGAPKVHWYKISPNGWPSSGQDPVLVDQGVLDFGPQVATAFPAIAVTGDDAGAHRAVIVYSRSSPAEPLAVWRSVIDQTGAVVNSEMWKQSEAPNQGFRWGDYFGVEEDPSDPGVFWGHGQYQGQTAWRTWVGRVDSANP